jgi:tetratricopeptide (TPR) repeat protein
MSSKNSTRERWRQTWPLAAIAGFVAVSGLALWFVPSGTNAKVDATTANDIQVEVGTNLSEPVHMESRWAKPTREEEVRAAIEHYTYEIEHNGTGAETAHNVYRLANLYYSTLRDYENASVYYVTLIQDYPDYSGIQTVFANLITCYERLGKNDLRRNTLRQMMEHYGEGSEQYLFAEEQLSRL